MIDLQVDGYKNQGVLTYQGALINAIGFRSVCVTSRIMLCPCRLC